MSQFQQSTFIQITLGTISLLLVVGLLLTTLHISLLQSQESKLNKLIAKQVLDSEHIAHLSARLLINPKVDSLWNDLTNTEKIWSENQKIFITYLTQLRGDINPNQSSNNSLEKITRYQEKVSTSVDALYLEFDEPGFQNYAAVIQQNSDLFNKGVQSVAELLKANLLKKIGIFKRLMWWQIIILLSVLLVIILKFFLKDKPKRFDPTETEKSLSSNSVVLNSPTSEIRLKHSLNIQKTINDNLRNAKNTAEEISRAKGQFLATLSHEIRNPVNAILGLSDLLLESSSEKDRIENLKNLHFSAQHLRALVDNILDLGKIEANRIELVITSFDLLATVKGVMQSYKSGVEEKGVELKLNIDPNLPSLVMGDSLKISQILNNLLSNAIKFTLHGAIQISLTILEEDDQSVAIGFEVKDTGIGIPEEKLETLFDEFTQVKNDITHKFGGTGLGLTITKKLVELLGGSIEVHSEPNRGTKFFFDIRFEKYRQALDLPKDKGIKNTTRNLVGLSVLVAEDDKLNQVVLRQFLKKWKARFDLVDNGALAVQLINQKSYDVILMDLNMPEMDGISAASIIRRAGINTPIIALTGSEENGFLDELMKKGFTDLALKPFVPEDLFLLLNTYLSTKTENV